MDYEIIFYHSGKTAETERLIEKSFGRIGLERHSSSAAMKPSELAGALKRAMNRSNAAVVIGGLDGSRQSTDSILSAVLSSKAGTLKSERLVNDSGSEAYLIRAGKQCILLFPDETEIIGEMLDKRLLGEIKRFFDLDESEDDAPSIEEVTEKLRKQLAGMPPAGSSYALACAEKRSREIRLLRWLSIGVGVSGVIMLILSIILFAAN